MIHDHTSVHPILLVLVSVGYLIIAAQFYHHIKNKTVDRDGTIAVAALMGIFLLCDLSGYMSELLPPGDFKYWFRTASHVLLVIVTYAYIIMAQAVVIAKILNKND